MEPQTSKPIRKTQAVSFVEGKYCSRCGRFYPFSFYIRNNATRDGYRRACCFCNAATLKTKNHRAEAWKEIERLQQELGADYIKFKPADENPDKKPEPVAVAPAVEIQASSQGVYAALAFVSDDMLIAEIRRRGYVGSLQIQRVVAVTI